MFFTANSYKQQNYIFYFNELFWHASWFIKFKHKHNRKEHRLMKKILGTIIAMLLTVTISFGSELLLKSENHTFFKAKINGIMYSPINGGIKIENLHPGNYEIHFYRNGHGNHFYHVKTSFITISRGEKVFATLTRHNNVTVSSITTNQTHSPHHSSRYEAPNREHYRAPAYTKAPHHCSPSRDFNYYMNRMRNCPFNSERMDIAYDAIDNLYLNTNQVKNLMNYISFDSERLELAKYAYTRVSDPENFYQVENALTFSSSKDELYRYIARNVYTMR